MFQHLYDDSTEEGAKSNSNSQYRRRRLTISEDVDRINMATLRFGCYLCEVATTVALYEQSRMTPLDFLFSGYRYCTNDITTIMSTQDSDRILFLAFIMVVKFALSLYYNLFVILHMLTVEVYRKKRSLRIGFGIHGRWRCIRRPLSLIQLLIFIVVDIDYAIRVLDTFLDPNPARTSNIGEDSEDEDEDFETKSWVIASGSFLIYNLLTVVIHIGYLLVTAKIVTSPRVSIFYATVTLHSLLLLLLAIDFIYAVRSGRFPGCSRCTRFCCGTGGGRGRGRTTSARTSVPAQTIAVLEEEDEGAKSEEQVDAQKEEKAEEPMTTTTATTSAQAEPTQTSETANLAESRPEQTPTEEHTPAPIEQAQPAQATQDVKTDDAGGTAAASG